MNAIGPLIRFLQLPKEFAGSHGLSAFPPRPAGSSMGQSMWVAPCMVLSLFLTLGGILCLGKLKICTKLLYFKNERDRPTNKVFGGPQRFCALEGAIGFIPRPAAGSMGKSAVERVRGKPCGVGP